MRKRIKRRKGGRKGGSERAREGWREEGRKGRKPEGKTQLAVSRYNFIHIYISLNFKK